jgi:hypothetical protein
MMSFSSCQDDDQTERQTVINVQAFNADFLDGVLRGLASVKRKLFKLSSHFQPPLSKQT